MYANEKKYVVALHVHHHRPLPLRSMVRLSLGSSRRHQGSRPRLRQDTSTPSSRSRTTPASSSPSSSASASRFELPILIFFLSLFGIVDAKFLLQAHPLRHPRHLPHRRHHLPDARPDRHVPLRHAHARSLYDRRRRCVPRPPRPPQSQRGTEARMTLFDATAVPTQRELSS